MSEEHLQRIMLTIAQLQSRFACLESPIPCSQCLENRNLLDVRRKKEADDLMALDSASIPAGQHWYLISQPWLSRWLRFKSNATDDLPGPIENRVLFEDDACTQPNQGLQRGAHYRGVNRDVWRYLHAVYGGGPAVVRTTINLYSAPVMLPEDSPGNSDVDIID